MAAGDTWVGRGRGVLEEKVVEEKGRMGGRRRDYQDKQFNVLNKLLVLCSKIVCHMTLT